MKNTIQRLKEPSTWGGVAAIAQAVAQLLVNVRDPVAWGALSAGLVAVFMKEAAQ